MEYNENEIKKAWNDFFQLNMENVSGVNSVVLESWKRSKAMGIDPNFQEMSSDDLKNRDIAIRKNYKLIDIAKPYMNHLYSTISGTNFMVTLVDNQGIVIDALTHPSLLEKTYFKLNNLSEDRIGTNALGTCIYLDKPFQTYGWEHFYKEMHVFTTSAAPIHDGDGNLIGAIGMTGFSEDVSVHTLGMAISSAYAIENKLKLSNDISDEIIKGYCDLMKNTTKEAILVLDKKFKITSISKTAETILNSAEDMVLNKDIDKILNNELSIKETIENNIFRNKIDIQGKIYDLSIDKISIQNQMLGYSLRLTRVESIDIKLNAKKTNNLYSFENISGKSSAIKESIEIAKFASRGISNVLILGESGTGKELFAQAIHNNSLRSNKPFIDVNCGALPMGLAESELFGYEGGAYTGSKREGNLGKFELANGGTIFLDEIGEMPLQLQAMLLRVIQERKVSKIGSTKSKDIDVMIIAATNKNLYEEVKENRFRADLFYRLNVFNINIPSLRERKDDIEGLSMLFISRYNEIFNKNILGINTDVLDIFYQYNWPGNIRELENIIQRAVQISNNDHITKRDLPIYLTDGIYIENISPNNIIKTNEHKLILEILKENKGNAKLTSEKLGISRSTLYRKIEKMGYSINDFRI